MENNKSKSLVPKDKIRTMHKDIKDSKTKKFVVKNEPLKTPTASKQVPISPPQPLGHTPLGNSPTGEAKPTPPPIPTQNPTPPPIPQPPTPPTPKPTPQPVPNPQILKRPHQPNPPMTPINKSGAKNADSYRESI